MAGQLGVAVLDTAIDLSGLRSGFNAGKAEAETQSRDLGDRGGKSFGLGFTEAWSKIQIAGMLLRPLKEFAQQAISVASEVVESQNLVNEVFLDQAADIETWAEKSSASLVQTEIATQKQAATFMSMLTNMGLARTESGEMSKALTELTADMASFYNLTPEEAFIKVRAGLSGEIEPLKQLGIVIDEAATQQEALASGLAKTTAELTIADKVQARYTLLMRQTATAQGDVVRTQDDFANATRNVEAAYQEFLASLGESVVTNEDVGEGLKEIGGYIRDMAQSGDLEAIGTGLVEWTKGASEFVRIMRDNLPIITSGMEVLNGLVNPERRTDIDYWNNIGRGAETMAGHLHALGLVSDEYYKGLQTGAAALQVVTDRTHALQDSVDDLALAEKAKAQAQKDAAAAAQAEANHAQAALEEQYKWFLGLSDKARELAAEDYPELAKAAQVWFDQNATALEKMQQNIATEVEAAAAREEAYKKHLASQEKIVDWYNRQDESIKALALVRFPQIAAALEETKGKTAEVTVEIEKWAAETKKAEAEHKAVVAVVADLAQKYREGDAAALKMVNSSAELRGLMAEAADHQARGADAAESLRQKLDAQYHALTAQQNAQIAIADAARGGNVEAQRYVELNRQVFNELDAQLTAKFLLLDKDQKQNEELQKSLMWMAATKDLTDELVNANAAVAASVPPIADEWDAVTEAIFEATNAARGMQAYSIGIGDPRVETAFRDAFGGGKGLGFFDSDYRNADRELLRRFDEQARLLGADPSNYIFNSTDPNALQQELEKALRDLRAEMQKQGEEQSRKMDTQTSEIMKIASRGTKNEPQIVALHGDPQSQLNDLRAEGVV